MNECLDLKMRQPVNDPPLDAVAHPLKKQRVDLFSFIIPQEEIPQAVWSHYPNVSEI